MSFQTPITIMSVIQGIQSNEYVLPAIQREFVWNATQIERIFDSLMRGYPIGSFLFWRIKAENVEQFQYYQFMDHFHERDFRHNLPIELIGKKDIIAILDGQQRLTSLNIGLRGWYAYKLPYYRWDSDHAFPPRQLYLNLLHRPNPDEDYAYEFRMLRDQDLKAAKDDAHWFPISEISKLNGVDDAFYYCVEHDLTQDKDKTASGNLITLWRMVHEQPIINFYQESSQDLEKVLNIFIRVNSGGTTLSYSDMLLSIATAQWREKDARREINDLIDALNKRGEGFQFTKDFVLKACLVLAEVATIQFKVSNFTRKVMLNIEERWDEIARSLHLATALLASWGYSWQTLPSNNAVIPIAYYLYQKQNPANFVDSAQFKEDRQVIRRWLAVALVKRVFSGQSDTTLSTIRRILQSNTDGFPADAIADALRQTRPMYFARPELDGLLSYQYGQRYTFIILSLLYPWLKYDQHFHMDHIFPRSMFTEQRLEKLGIPKERWGEWMDHYNDLGNIQLLQGLANLEKSDQDFESWLQNATSGKPDMEHYLHSHLIPDVELHFGNFPVFLAAREKLILDRLAQILDVQLDAPVVELESEAVEG